MNWLISTKFILLIKQERLTLVSGKVQRVETKTHQIAHNIKHMEDHIHSSKDDQDTVDRPKMDEE